MIALSITLKLLTWCLALRYGDAGRASHPWILGIIVGMVFAGCGLCTGYTSQRNDMVLSAAYLVSGVALMNICYRIQEVALSLLFVAIGTVIFFIGVPGVPYLTNIVFE